MTSKHIELNRLERDMIGGLATALYAANSDGYHCQQSRTFGAIADALFATVEHAVAQRKDALLMEAFRDQFYASWGGEVGDTAAGLVQHLLNQASFG